MLIVIGFRFSMMTVVEIDLSKYYCGENWVLKKIWLGSILETTTMAVFNFVTFVFDF